MHFEQIRNKLNFVKAWKILFAEHQKRQVQIWASNAQWHKVWN